MTELEIIIMVDGSFDEGEYEIYIQKIIGDPLNIDDIEKIRECINDELSDADFQEDCPYCVQIRETGEFEDVRWNRYYTLNGKPFPVEFP